MKEKEIDYEVVQDEMEKENGGNQHSYSADEDNGVCWIWVGLVVLVASALVVLSFL